MKNKELVLAYLKEGRTLTAYDGFTKLGIVSVRDYVSMLRKDGYNIAGEWRESLESGKRWKEYWLIACLLIFMIPGLCYAETGKASYYTYESCRKEGTSGVFTATGERYNENDLTCARPRRSDFGKIFKVTNKANGKEVIVRCNDLGPSKKLYAKGRIIDLSRAAFSRLDSTKKGIILVEVANI